MTATIDYRELPLPSDEDELLNRSPRTIGQKFQAAIEFLGSGFSTTTPERHWELWMSARRKMDGVIYHPDRPITLTYGEIFAAWVEVELAALDVEWAERIDALLERLRNGEISEGAEFSALSTKVDISINVKRSNVLRRAYQTTWKEWNK